MMNREVVTNICKRQRPHRDKSEHSISGRSNSIFNHISHDCDDCVYTCLSSTTIPVTPIKMNTTVDVFTLTYHDYITTPTWCEKDSCYYGRIENINNMLVTWEASSYQECVYEFRAAVDDYLNFCDEIGFESEVPKYES